MTILVFGANGQVGREITDFSRSPGFGVHPVVGLGRDQVDITDQSAIKNCIDTIKPAMVINSAAYTAVDKAEQDVTLAFSVNRDGAGFIAQVCAASNIPLIHISTDYVFDGNKTSPYVEEDAVNPQSVYGDSKWQGEERIRQVLEQHIILRTSWVFGVYGKNFVCSIMRLAQQRDELRIVNDQQGCPTSASSISQTVLSICNTYLQQLPCLWGTYHYCGSPATTWFHFAKKIIELTKSSEDYRVKNVIPITTAQYPTPAKRPLNSVLDCNKIRNNFGIEQGNWEAGLMQMIQHAQFRLSS